MGGRRAVKPVYVLNGPNLGRLGSREPAVYGTASYADLVAAVEAEAAALGLAVDVRQTDDEATLIGWLHSAADESAAVVLNPAAFTHYSYAVRDAAQALGVPLVEVHLTNVAAREEFRRHSVISDVARGTIAGFGIDSYRLALRAVNSLLSNGDPLR
ncbi:MAG: type II 3-dehydroquinate dehydratase [Mycobacteriales bacterium]